MKLRAPCIPLITVDPFFSVWSATDSINYSETINWTGKNNSIIGTVTVDGKKQLFLGYHRDINKMKQVSLEIDALSTVAVFENDKISLTAKFLSPVIADDLTLLTRPVSYLEVSYKSLDGNEHDVSINICASEELCLEDVWENEVETKEVVAGKTKGMSIGNVNQKPLNKSGDLVLIDWGYFYLTTDAEKCEIKETKIFNETFVSIDFEIEENASVLCCFAYDDIESIEYFGKKLKSYWNKDGKTILEAIAEAADEYKAVEKRCKEFSKKLYDDAFEAGGEKYAEMLSLAYRQVIAAHKLVLDENGEILYISKE